MDEDTLEKLAEISYRLNSLVAVLCGYCDNFVESSKEISNLVDFSRILKETASMLYELF